MCRVKFKWSKLSAAIYGINQLCMPRVSAYNEIHECVGGEVYITLPTYNDIHGAIALYGVSKLAHLNFALHVVNIRAYMPFPPLFGGSMRPWHNIIPL